ncbi:MAG: transcriptional repressor [Eubacteriales bacterium]|nr:transcriptional repressor [Eubacteriales bacterium]
MRYNTKQREAMLAVLREHMGKGITVRQLVQIMKDRNTGVGESTLYRRMRHFEDENLVRSYKLNGESYYEFLPQDDCMHHLHLVCKNCHRTLHLDCDFMEHFNDHVLKEHGFRIDRPKSVIYGVCKECAEEDE